MITSIGDGESGAGLGRAGIRAAIDAIVSEALRAGAQRAERDAVPRLIGVTDGIIAELEELNLQDVPSVPEPLRARALLALACIGLAPRLRAQPTPTQVLDALFDAQQRLFDWKHATAPAAS